MSKRKDATVAAVGSTLYDKLNLLTAELQHEIVILRGEDEQHNVSLDLQRLKEESEKETSPEATHSLLLFRKYSDIANEVKDRNDELEARFASLEAPPFGIGGTLDGQGKPVLVGLMALNANIFWLRVLALLFSCISFVIMANVPHISDTALRPQLKHCPHIEGYFYMGNYRLVMFVGIAIFIYTIITLTYYLLPVDKDRQKYIPGFRTMLGWILNDEQRVEHYISRWGGCARYLSRFLEMLIDYCLVVVSLIMFIIAACAVEIPIGVTQYGYWRNFTLYLSLNSFVQTTVSQRCRGYEDMEPMVPRIRASLAMLFLAMVVLVLCIRASYRDVQLSENGTRERLSHDVESARAASFEYDDHLNSGNHNNDTNSGNDRNRMMRNHEAQRFSAGAAVSATGTSPSVPAGKENYFSIEGDGEFEETEL